MNFLLVALSLSAVAHGNQEALGVNPIRKIVNLLQNMQKEIEEEGAKEKELFDKFMCFCSGNNGDLTKAAEDAKAKIEELTAALNSDEATKVQTEQELGDAKADRSGAKSDLEEAAMLRAKEAKEFAEEKADSETNLAAMASAIPAIEKGMGGASFLQVPGADRVKKLVSSYPSVSAMDRKNALAFLEAGTGDGADYAPASGQIVGILKAMKDDMEASLKEAVADEEKAISGFADLKASKEKEIEMATEAIETKTGRAGELAVSIVQTKDSLEDTTVELADTQKFLAQLESQCATKEKEWAERTAVRNQEIKAIGEAIGILNDDDALDVFKKAAPAAMVQEVGFLQRANSPASKVRKAKAILASIAGKSKSSKLNLILFALNSKLKLHGKGKTQNLAGIIKMIDDMVVLLGKDQEDDEKHKEFCETEFEKSGDEKKAATTKASQLAAQIEVTTDALSTLSDDIAALVQDVKDLDKAVAEATEQRKEEHADFLEAQQLSEAAIQLIGKAKNRLQKFYNPTLYKAPPKVENTMEEKIIEAGTFAQIRSHDGADFGAYQPSEKSAGVLGLMDMMSKELETDMKDAAYEEKTSQTDYQKLMEESQATRAANTKSITAKEAEKAASETSLVSLKDAKTATDEDLSLINSYIGELHTSCDFIVQNFDLRKEARSNEVEGLKNAKAILSGANFGF